jgi:proline iminopeptidase
MNDPALQRNLYDSLTLLKFPVLIIHGEADNLPLSSINRLKNNLRNSDLVILSRSGHFPFVEEQENYMTIVKNFFK